eukprot:s2032_g16.t1
MLVADYSIYGFGWSQTRGQIKEPARGLSPVQACLLGCSCQSDSVCNCTPPRQHNTRHVLALLKAAESEETVKKFGFLRIVTKSEVGLLSHCTTLFSASAMST